MRKFNVEDISVSLAHNQVPRKALIKQGDSKTNLQTVNDADLKPNCCFKPHSHPGSEEIYYFLEGEGEMVVDDKKFKVRKGDVAIVEVGESHGLKKIVLAKT